MRYLLLIVSWVAVYALVVRYLYPTLGRWQHDDKSPYYMRLFGVFVVVVLFVLIMFGLPAAVMALTENWAPPLPNRRRMFGSDWRGLTAAAAQLGVAAVGIRVGYDLLRKLPNALAKVRPKTK